MSLFEVEAPVVRATRVPIPLSAIDHALTAQLTVAWAGESGEDEKRPARWRTDLVSEFGGMDLFRRLLPSAAEWAVLRSVVALV